jgi:hypothetical protein
MQQEPKSFFDIQESHLTATHDAATEKVIVVVFLWSDKKNS